MIQPSARRRAAGISLAVSFVVLAIKVAAYAASGSSSLLSDALETVVNVITATVAFFILDFATQPADEDHPYGHGKAEFVSAAFEGGLVVFAALAIIVEGARALVFGVHLKDLSEGMLLAIVASMINLVVGLYIRKIGRRESSVTLEASAVHLLSDVKTTGAVVIGLLLVQATGWTWLDPVLAILVGVHLVWEGGTIVRRSFAGLVDEMDEKSLTALSESMQRHRQPGIIDIHLMRAIRSGSFHHIDAHMVVPEYWDVLKVHEMAHEFERKVMVDYPFDGEFAFHQDPCRRKYCEACEVSDCPIRREPFQRRQSFDIKNLISPSEYA